LRVAATIFRASASSPCPAAGRADFLRVVPLAFPELDASCLSDSLSS